MDQQDVSPAHYRQEGTASGPQHHGSQPAEHEGDEVPEAGLEVDSLSPRERDDTGQLYVADCSQS